MQLITRVKKDYLIHSESPAYDFDNTNHIIFNLNTLHNLEISLVRMDISYANWYKRIKPIHLLWKKKTINEENKINNKEILKCIDTRCANLKVNEHTIINSLLDAHKSKITLDRILIKSNN